MPCVGRRGSMERVWLSLRRCSEPSRPSLATCKPFAIRHSRSRAVPKPFLHKAPLVVQGVSSTKPSNDNPDTFQVKPRASNSWHLLMVCMRGDRDLSMTMRCLSNGWRNIYFKSSPSCRFPLCHFRMAEEAHRMFQEGHKAVQKL